MIKTSGAYVDLLASFARCSTPKRCCSSVTTRESLANRTSSCNKAWVPTTISTKPSSKSINKLLRSLARIPPVSKAIRMPKGAKYSVKVS